MTMFVWFVFSNCHLTKTAKQAQEVQRCKHQTGAEREARSIGGHIKRMWIDGAMTQAREHPLASGDDITSAVKVG